MGETTMKKFIILVGLAVALFLSVLSGYAAEQKKSANAGIRKLTADGPFSTLVNINNISMWVSYDGASARNPSTGNSGVTFPRGTSTSIYSDGFVWGGNVSDGGSQVLRVNGGTYQQGNVGGRIISKGVAEDAGGSTVRIYRVRRDYETASLNQDAAELLGVPLKNVSDGDIAAVRAQYKLDWLQWPASKGAPYYDRNHNGIYDPDPSGKYDPTKDEPGVADADQVVWFVINDLNGAQSVSFEGSDPIGMEVQVTLWGYARTDQLGNVIFKKYKFVYKGTTDGNPTGTISNMYIGQWADPDLGDYSDDYEACDTLRVSDVGTVSSLGYVYNSTTVDRNYRTYNLAPPAMGYDFFAGPIAPGVAGEDLNKNGVDDANDFAVFDLKLKGPGYINLPMTSWIYFAAGGTYSDPPFDYVGAGQWYNLLRGLTPVDGSPFQYDAGEPPTKYWLSGDPVAGTGYLDGNIDAPGDRRMVMASGPFQMKYDYTVSPARTDTQEVVVALLGGSGSDVKSSISVLRFNDVSAQYAYDNLFELPKAPPAPKLQIGELDNQIVLNWGYDDAAVLATESDDSKGYKFEGYNVYQLPSATATINQGIRLATYDLVNEYTTIKDRVFDQASGQVLERPVQLGKNSGLSRYLVLSQDILHSKPLVNGQPYYFAVTSYNYNPSPVVPVHSIENPLLILTAIPQSPKPGVRYSQGVGDTLAPIAHAGKSEGRVVPIVLDPTKLSGDTYRVTFATDTVTGGPVWNVDNLRTSTRVLANQTNQTGDELYPILDGFQLKVMGPDPGMKAWEITAGVRRFSPVGGFAGLGLEGFGSAADPTLYDVNSGTIGMAGHLAFGGIGTTLDVADYSNVVLKLAAVDPTNLWDPLATPSDTNFSRAYRYLRRAAAAPGDPSVAPWIINPVSGYPYQDFNYAMPFSAWNTETNPPTRLAVGVFENNISAADVAVEGVFVDGRYWPGTAASNDNSVVREFAFIFNAPYSTTPDPALMVNMLGNASTPLMWVMVCNRRNTSAWTGSDEFSIIANHVNTAVDTFSFVSPAPSTSSATAKSDVTKINAFPNPYYGFNRAETSRFSRFVTFNHLPPGDWRIRIFNLAGTMVRKIGPSSANQSSTSQFATWDLNNENGLPVASGIYIAHIIMPNLGETKILKLIIIQEQQILDYY